MNKRELTDQAKAKLNDNPQEAYELYVKVWEEFPDDQNEWDSFFLLKSIRMSKQRNDDLESIVIEKFGENDRVKGIFSWLLFDRFNAEIEQNDFHAAENTLNLLTDHTEQKDKTGDEEFPCPYSICVLKMADHYKKPNFNAEKVGQLLGKLDEDKLSTKVSQLKDKDGKERELASDLEKYYSLKSKYLYETEEYDECMLLVEKAFGMIEKMHYDNQIWFSRRKALCLLKKGEVEQAEKILKSLIQDSAGNKWFIHKEIADILLQEGHANQALEYAVESALTGTDYDKKIDLLILIARILIKLDRNEDAEINAKLLICILKREEFNIRDKHNKMMGYFKFSLDDELDYKQLMNQAKAIWEEEKWKWFDSEDGVITKIHQNKKSGFIQSDGGDVRFFSKNELGRKATDIEKMLNAKVSYKIDPSKKLEYNEKNHALNVKVKELAKPSYKQIELGKVYKGEIGRIMKYGIFVNVLPGISGLVHISNIDGAHSGKELNDWFKQGQQVKVRVLEISSKGLDLRLVDN